MNALQTLESLLANAPNKHLIVSDPLFLDNQRVICCGKTITKDTRCVTKWTDCVMFFDDQQTINGSGVSVFEGVRMPFIIFGTYCPLYGIGKIVKVYISHEIEPIVQHITIKKSPKDPKQMTIHVFNDYSKGALCATVCPLP